MKTFEILFLILVILSFICINVSVAKIPGVDEHVKLYFKFDEGSGNVVNDLSGNNNNGIITGAKWVEGKFGKALKFNGAANDDKEVNYVEIKDSKSLQIIDSITIEAWVNPTDVDCGYVLLKKNSYGGPKFVGGTYEFYLEVGGQQIVNKVAEKVIPGVWQHFAVVYDGKDMRQYLNGELLLSKPQAGTIKVSSDNVYIGNSFGWHASGAKNFIGIIDEVRLSDVARTVDEIKESMKGYSSAVNPGEKLAINWGQIKKN